VNGTQRRTVGGWLLYYCISRSVFEPLYFLWTAKKLGSPIEIWIEVLFALAGIFAVVLIVKRRQEAFIWIGSDLILRILFGGTVLVRKYLHPVTRPNQRIDPNLIALIIFAVGLVGPLAWFLYFKRSERVRGVLGRNIGILL
jgi:hypothetical protein